VAKPFFCDSDHGSLNTGAPWYFAESSREIRMSHDPSFRNRRDEPPCGSAAAAIRRAFMSSKEVAVRNVMRDRYADAVMCMYVASFSPDTPNARADAAQALNLFFDGTEEVMTRLPPYTEGAEWDNRRKQLLG
jgi:hypothetical protein